MKKKHSNKQLREMIEIAISTNETTLTALGLYDDIRKKNTDDKAEVFIHRILEMYQDGAADNGIHMLVAWTLFRHALSDLSQFLND